MEADRPFRRLFRKGKRLFRRGYGHEHRYRPSSQAGNYRGRPLGRLRSKAEVSLPPPFHHRRPPKHRSRSVARCRATDTGRPRRFPAPAPRCRGQLRARSGHPRADRARRAPHARTFVARLPRLRLEPSGVLRAEGPGPPSHDAGPPRIAPGHLRRHRRLGAASRSASGLLVAPSGSRRRRLALTPPPMPARPRARPWTGGGRARCPPCTRTTPLGPTSPTARPRWPPPALLPWRWPWLTWPRPVTPTYTPVAFAQWATDHDLTAAGADTVGARSCSRPAPPSAWPSSPWPSTTRTLRHAIVSNVPVLVVTQPGTFAPDCLGGGARRHRQGLPHRAARPDEREPLGQGLGLRRHHRRRRPRLHGA